MMKIFRRYQNYLLVVGGTLLMLIFLIEPALNKFGNHPGDQVIGTVKGRKIQFSDEINANNSLQLINRLTPLMSMLCPQDGTVWMLAQMEAREMGLSASDSEVSEILESIGLGTGDKLDANARRIGVAPAQIRRVLAEWLIFQRYRELVLGLGHTPLSERLAYLSFAGQLMQAGNREGVMMAMEAGFGAPRLSLPAIQRFVYDRMSRLTITAVPVSAASQVDASFQPPAEKVQALFDRYRDVLPGEGETYGLGYRRPPGIKLEYLLLPFERVEKSIEIDEADAVAFYEEHKEDYRPEPPAAEKDKPFALKPAPKPYLQVRDEVVARIRREKATTLAEQMARAAQSMLGAQLAAVPEKDGYKEIPADFAPTPLEEVAKALQERFGLMPDVVKVDQWLTGVDMTTQQQLVIMSVPLPRGMLPLVEYLFSAREIHPGEPNPLAFAPAFVQVGVPVVPAPSFFGDRAVVRLTAARPAASPQSLDEVRDRVIADARLLAAYEKLVADKDKWLTQAKNMSLEDFAKALGVTVLRPTPFSGRDFSPTGTMEASEIEGIGSDEKLVDGLFQLAEQIAKVGIANAPEDARRGVFAVDKNASLYIVRIEDYVPITRSQFESVAMGPGVAARFHRAVLRMGGNEGVDSLSLESIKKRVGFIPASSPEGSQAEK